MATLKTKVESKCITVKIHFCLTHQLHIESKTLKINFARKVQYIFLNITINHLLIDNLHIYKSYLPFLVYIFQFTSVFFATS